MDLPLHEQLRNDQWRRMIEAAGPGDLNSLKRIALTVLEYAATSRAFALEQAAALLPRQGNAPAAEAAGASSPCADDQNSSS
jgi:hypothetical protein